MESARLVDSQFQFNRVRANEAQALQWPRDGCLDLDGNLVAATALSPVRANFVSTNLVPKPAAATLCEVLPGEFARRRR